MNSAQKVLVGVLLGVGLVTLLMAIFMIGVMVGRKSGPGRFLPMWEGRGLRGEFVPMRMKSHGVFGVVESVGETSMVIKERDGELKTVVWDELTRFEKDRSISESTEVATGQTTIVMGEPNATGDAVQAIMIRIIDQGSPAPTPTQTQEAR